MRRRSSAEQQCDVTGHAIWLYPDGEPWLIGIEGILFLPVFSTEEKVARVPDPHREYRARETQANHGSRRVP